MKRVPNRLAKAGSKTGKSSLQSAKPAPKKVSKPAPAPNSKAAKTVQTPAPSISPSAAETPRATMEQIPAEFAEMLRELGIENKPAEKVDAGRCTNKEFETNGYRWLHYRGEVSGLAYHLAAAHTGYDVPYGVTEGGLFEFQMRLRDDLPLWEDYDSTTVCAEDRLIQTALRSSGDSDRFPADMLLRGAERMLEEYVALLACERESLRGHIDPDTYPLLLGLFAIRFGGWWDNPHCDPVPHWTPVHPGHGTLIEYIWKVGPQTGASGQFGQVVDEARWTLEAMFGPKSPHKGTLLELVLMDTCRLAIAHALREAKAGVDLRERTLSWMDRLLGPNAHDKDAF